MAQPENAAAFRDPPPEAGPVLWWGWTGEMTREVLARDLDAIGALGFPAVMIEAGYGLSPRYLSDEWFASVREAVALAGERGMRVYLVDEGKYPSGFAGGKFTRERPDLCMQGLAVAERVPVGPGETFARAVDPAVVGALALNTLNEEHRALDILSGRVRWTAPAEGEWQVWLVDHAHRTAVTRDVHNPTQEKDASSSLCDYLDPAATRQFIAWVHARYAEALGEALGRTVLGMRSDEPDYAHLPWTTRLPEAFAREKGYDVRPHLAAFFAPHPDERTLRARADYWDVWSTLFADSFFRPLGDWCAAHGLEYLVHLNHEDALPRLVRSEGDFFRPMRHVSVPGVDAIWNQIWPGRVADFPLLAASAAHLGGRPRAFSESFAAYRTPPDLAQAKWVIDHQLARGINLFEFMFYPSSASAPERRGFMADPGFPALAAYVRRASYLLSRGRPAADLALYYPTMSLWLGDEGADAAAWRAVRALLERQRGVDLVDDDSLAEGEGPLCNGFGEPYRAVLVPPTRAISRAALERLRESSAAGQEVAVLGPAPALVVTRTFRDARGPADVSWARSAPEEDPARVLPAGDVALDRPAPGIVVHHRRWAGAECYMILNELNEPARCTAHLAGALPARTWDARTGEVRDLPEATREGTAVRLPLRLAPWEARIVVLGAS